MPDAVWDLTWQRTLFDAGYAGINWPKEYGGRGATPTEHLIYIEESERARAPYVGCNFVGQLHGGPTLIAEGTHEQKLRYLPPILRGDEVWCQGFSEPNAGSDLASLRTRAVRDGDDYVLSGQKIWTSFGHIADYCEMLVRTDPDAPKHKGISWLIVPMHLPGIDVRPLRVMEGTTEFCEVFLDDVRVPIENRVGDENDGWRVTNVTLSFERGTAFVSDVIETRELIHDLVDLAKHLTSKGATRWEDAGLASRGGQARRRARRSLVAHEAQHLAGPTHGRGRRGRQRVQAGVRRAAPAPGRHRHAPPRPGVAVDRRRGRAAVGAVRRVEVLGHPDGNRRRHVTGAAQHRR